MAYHDALFTRQNMLGHFSFAKLASNVGLNDTMTFNRCMGMGLFGFFLAALIAFNIQVGTGGNFFGVANAKTSNVSVNAPVMNCPPKIDNCVVSVEAGIIYSEPGKPITVTAPAPKKPIKN